MHVRVVRGGGPRLVRLLLIGGFLGSAGTIASITAWGLVPFTFACLGGFIVAAALFIRARTRCEISNEKLSFRGPLLGVKEFRMADIEGVRVNRNDQAPELILRVVGKEQRVSVQDFGPEGVAAIGLELKARGIARIQS